MALKNTWIDGEDVNGTAMNDVANAVNALVSAGDGYAPGGTDVAVADGGTGASTASGARTNLGLVPGTDVQAYDADLTSLAALTAPATKLSGIATGATANSTDASLRDRSTHTGSQTSSTISDFTEAVQDAVGAALSGVTGVTVAYDDTAGTITITGSGSGGGLDAEAVRDAIGVAMVGVGVITVAVNDAADTITISSVATANDTDANLKNRANHTGSQTASTISDFLTVARAAFMTGTVATASSTTAKTVTLDSPWASVVPAAGDIFLLTFTNPNTTAAPTININATSARSVKLAGSSPGTGVQLWSAGAKLLYYFDGTSMHLLGSPLNVSVDATTTASTIPQRDASANLTTNMFIAGCQVSATAAGNSALTILSKPIWVYTGTTTQTHTLPTTSILAGMPYAVINLSTGLVTVNASGGTTVAILRQGESVVVSANQNTPTTNAHWAVVGGTYLVNGQTITDPKIAQSINAQTGTTYTLVLTDASRLVTLNNASAIALTVPPNSSVAFPIGIPVDLLQYGAGQVTITAGAGVTLRSRGAALKTNAQYSPASLMKLGTDEWLVTGDVTA